MKTTLHLIRHGETIWNRENRIQGWADSPLTEEGKSQAEKLAPYLKKKKIKAATSSDQGRALKTGEIALNGTPRAEPVVPLWSARSSGDIRRSPISDSPHGPTPWSWTKADGTVTDIKLFKDLRERNLGAWEGRIWTDVVKEDPAGTKEYHLNPLYRPPEGETFEELQKRVFATVKEIVLNHPSQTVAVFTSGGPVRATLMAAMEVPIETWPRWSTWNTGITTVEVQDGRWKVIKFNDTAHLTPG